MSESLLAGEQGQQQQQQTEEVKTWTGEDGSFAPGVFEKLPEHLKSHKATFEKYKSVPELFQAHVSLEQLLGKKANAVVPPGEKATDEEKAAWRKAHRVPEDGKYNLKPKDLPEGVTWNEANEEAWNRIFAENAISPEGANAIISKFMADRKGQVSQTQQEIEAANEARKQENFEFLRKEWGPKTSANVEIARRAALTAGVDPTSEGFADPAVVLGYYRLGAMMSEDKLVKADSAGMQNPAALAKQIISDKLHPMHEKYMKGDPETAKYVTSLYQRAEALGITA